jgi:hypothetical protein
MQLNCKKKAVPDVSWMIFSFIEPSKFKWFVGDGQHVDA